MDYKQINIISRALAHYVFRNGAVENIHAEGRLTQEDMETLNKDVHNRIAGLLTAYSDGKTDAIVNLVKNYSIYGKDWDECTPFLDEIDFLTPTEKTKGKFAQNFEAAKRESTKRNLERERKRKIKDDDEILERERGYDDLER